MAQSNGINTASASGARAPRTPATTRARRGDACRPSATTNVCPKTACETGSIQVGASAEPFVGILLRIPVSIELIPVLRVLPDAGAQLIRKLLRGLLNGLVARPVGRHHDRVAEQARKRRVALRALDKAGHQRCA